MIVGGIDIGSRYIKFVTVNTSDNITFHKAETGHNPLSVCQDLLKESTPDKIIATGYGRHLLEIHASVRTITEIKAVAKGARAIFPRCRTIIDIGGQDTKVIRLNAEGNVTAFEMNDRCAAGTGRFLEIMAKALGYELEDFGSSCSNHSSLIKISSLCTVFAESEIVGLITKGEDRAVIAGALHESVIQRILPLIQRIGMEDDIVFAGGCALNSCLREFLEARLQRRVYVHENPFLHAAYGAALYAKEKR